jgi:CBS domain-containing protein
MVTKHIRHLPVVDDGKLVGTVSRADICRAVVYGL